MGPVPLDSEGQAAKARRYATGVQGTKDPRLFYPVLFGTWNSCDEQDLSAPDDYKYNKGLYA